MMSANPPPTAGELRSRYIRVSGRAALLNTVVSAIVAVAGTPLLIRLLGLEIYGRWALVVSMSEVASLFELGVGKSLAVELARAPSTETRARLVGRAVSALLGIIAMSVVGLVAFLTFGHASNDSTAVVVSCVLTFAVFLVMSVVKATMEGLLQLKRAQILSLVETVGLYAGTIVVAIVATDPDGGSLWSILLVPATVLGLIQTSQSPWFRRHLGRWMPELAGPDEAWNFLARSRGFVGLGLVNSGYLPVVRGMFFLVGGAMAGHAILDVSLRVARASSSILSSLSLGTLGAFAASGSLENSMEEAVSMTKRLATVYAVLGVIGISLSSWGFEWLTGTVAPPTMLLAFIAAVAGTAIVGVTEPITRAFMGARRLRPILWAKLAHLGLVIVTVLVGWMLRAPATEIVLVAVGLSSSLFALSIWAIGRRVSHAGVSDGSLR